MEHSSSVVYKTRTHPSKILVCARLRPLIQEDAQQSHKSKCINPDICVHLKHDGQTVKLCKDIYTYNFYQVNHTFAPTVGQTDVYRLSLKNIVADVIGGYNGTGLVYGQTGSGKSYTMFGGDNGQSGSGIAQLSINDIFKAVSQHEEDGMLAKVYMSFYQIYVEQVYDLLVIPQSNELPQACSIREDVKRGVFVEGLTYMYVKDEQTALEVLRHGLKGRRIQSTRQNINSSRSHAILQLHLDFEERSAFSDSTAIDGDTRDTELFGAIYQRKYSVRRSMLTLVDLAGSERVKPYVRSMSKQQFKEAVMINNSISALGNCIQALSTNNAAIQHGRAGFNSNTHNRHVPFRDCKLTRLLAEPLGGNCKTVIIANIGPCTVNYEETQNTLKFATRAMVIKKQVAKASVEQVTVHPTESAIRYETESNSSAADSEGETWQEEEQGNVASNIDDTDDNDRPESFSTGHASNSVSHVSYLSTSRALSEADESDRFQSSFPYSHRNDPVRSPAPPRTFNLREFLSACQSQPYSPEQKSEMPHTPRTDTHHNRKPVAFHAEVIDSLQDDRHFETDRVPSRYDRLYSDQAEQRDSGRNLSPMREDLDLRFSNRSESVSSSREWLDQDRRDSKHAASGRSRSGTPTAAPLHQPRWRSTRSAIATPLVDSSALSSEHKTRQKKLDSSSDASERPALLSIERMERELLHQQQKQHRRLREQFSKNESDYLSERSSALRLRDITVDIIDQSSYGQLGGSPYRRNTSRSPSSSEATASRSRRKRASASPRQHDSSLSVPVSPYSETPRSTRSSERRKEWRPELSDYEPFSSEKKHSHRSRRDRSESPSVIHFAGSDRDPLSRDYMSRPAPKLVYKKIATSQSDSEDRDEDSQVIAVSSHDPLNRSVSSDVFEPIKVEFKPRRRSQSIDRQLKEKEERDKLSSSTGSKDHHATPVPRTQPPPKFYSPPVHDHEAFMAQISQTNEEAEQRLSISKTKALESVASSKSLKQSLSTLSLQTLSSAEVVDTSTTAAPQSKSPAVEKKLSFAQLDTQSAPAQPTPAAIAPVEQSVDVDAEFKGRGLTRVPSRAPMEIIQWYNDEKEKERLAAASPATSVLKRVESKTPDMIYAAIDKDEVALRNGTVTSVDSAVAVEEQKVPTPVVSPVVNTIKQRLPSNRMQLQIESLNHLIQGIQPPILTKSKRQAPSVPSRSLSTKSALGVSKLSHIDLHKINTPRGVLNGRSFGPGDVLTEDEEDEQYCVSSVNEKRMEILSAVSTDKLIAMVMHLQDELEKKNMELAERTAEITGLRTLILEL